MSSLRVVDVYADGQRVAYTYLDPEGYLWSDVKLIDADARP